MKSGALAFALLTSAVLGCNNASSARDDGTSPAPVAPVTPVSTLRPAIAWPAASAIDDAALASLVDRFGERDLRALVARSPVPLLAPKHLRLESPTLVVEGEYFALTGRVDGATISLQGTRAAHRYEGVEQVPGNRTLRGTRGFVSINEGIRTASWIENGAAYTVDVECSDVRDARCQGEELLLSIVEQLAYVGGSGR